MSEEENWVLLCRNAYDNNFCIVMVGEFVGSMIGLYATIIAFNNYVVQNLYIWDFACSLIILLVQLVFI